MTSKIIRACCVSGLAVLAGTQVVAALSDSEDQQVVLFEGWPTAPAVPAGDDLVDSGISGDELRGHVKAFSDDTLKGRPMGSDESLVAARYAAERLQAMGLKPGAADGTYFQRIDLYRTNFTAPSELHVVTKSGEKATLRYGAEFTFDTASASLETEELRCVFVASAEDLPESPDPGVALVFQTSSGQARRWLKDAGMANGAGFGMVLNPRGKSKVKEPSTKSGTGWRAANSANGTAVARLNGDWGDRAYAGELQSVTFVPKGTVERCYDVNVIGVLPGVGTEESPALKDEIVMLAAHRDHIGLLKLRAGEEAPEDMIRNGADDDASGCSVVLEVAEALASGEAPARTVVVVLVTGEEVGMVGSGFWASNPTVDPSSVVCALNFEMLGRPDPLTDGPGNIWLTGYERSNLGPLLREHGIEVTPDVRPTQNFFKRSDNVSFAKVGIVSQTLSSFGGHGDYHRVSDEWDTLDYAHMEAAAALSAAAVRDLVSGSWKPEWNEGEPKF